MKQAATMLIIKNGLILGVSRKKDNGKWGLVGGKVESSESAEQAAIRETIEESGLKINSCLKISQREAVDLAIPDEELIFLTHCFYALDWSGEPREIEKGMKVQWISAEELTSPITGAFPEYNRNALNVFKILFPNTYIQGE